MHNKEKETTPLHFAIANSMIDDVRLLVESGEDINSRDSKGKTPLILCSITTKEYNLLGIARMLLQAGAEGGLTDISKRNALMYSILFQKSALVLLLLQALDFPINQRDMEGNTALHYAVKTGNLKIAKTVIYEFVKQNLSLDCANKYGETAMESALKAGHADVVNVLLKNGSKMKKVVRMNQHQPFYQNNDTPQQTHLHAIKSVIESCKEHRSSSQFNTHQFRRQVMTKYQTDDKNYEYMTPRTTIKIHEFIGGNSNSARSTASERNGDFTSKNVSSQSKNRNKTYTWRSDMPKAMDVLKDQTSSSYRPSAIAKPQTIEEALKLIHYEKDETATEEDFSEDDLSVRPSKALLSRRRNTTVYRRSSSLSRSRTRSAGNVEMLQGINELHGRKGSMSNSNDELSSGSSGIVRRKKKKGTGKLDTFSDSASSSSSSSIYAIKKHPKTQDMTKPKNRPGSAAVRNKGMLPVIEETAPKTDSENVSEEHDIKQARNINVDSAQTISKNETNKNSKSDEDTRKSTTLPNQQIDDLLKNAENNSKNDPILNTRRAETKRKIPSDKVLSDISEESSVVSICVKKESSGIPKIKSAKPRPRKQSKAV